MPDRLELTPESAREISKNLRTIADALNTLAAVLMYSVAESSPVGCPQCGVPRTMTRTGSSILHLAWCPGLSMGRSAPTRPDQ